MFRLCNIKIILKNHLLKLSLVGIFFFLPPTNLKAQKIGFIDSDLNPFGADKAQYFTTDFKWEKEKNPSSQFSELLNLSLNEWKDDRSSFALVFQQHTLHSYHFQFRQHFKSIPIFNAFFKLNINSYGEIYSAYHTTFSTKDWGLDLEQQIIVLKEINLDSAFEQNLAAEISVIQKEIVLAVLQNTPFPVWHFKTYNTVTHDYRSYLINARQEILMNIDLNRYHKAEIAKGNVHFPDPLTTAKSNYTPPFINDNDNSNAFLEAQLFEMDIDVSLLQGNLVLENEILAIRDFDAPFLSPPTNLFNFNRSQPGFEAVNVFYHITSFQRYIQFLGFATLAPSMLIADANALNGDDNSLFSASTTPFRLFFGSGGVADAEDADVIIHEYSHALSEFANGANFGNERRALDEGIGDYFATSYSKAIDTFRWKDMFTWDGHNEFWNGRNAASTKIYPTDLTGSIHANGEMWNTALMQIWDSIGKEKTDKLMLQTLFALGNNFSFTNAAMEFLRSDTLLYFGDNFCSIYPVFLRIGFIDSLPNINCNPFNPSLVVDAGTDKTICYGDTTSIGNPTEITNGTFLWTPDLALLNPNEANTLAWPKTTTTYTLKRTTENGEFNMDTIVIQVQFCEIAIYNTIGFAQGQTDLKIILPFNIESIELSLYTATGSELFKVEKKEGGVYFLSGKDYAPGVYYLQIKSDKQRKVYRLLKTK